MIRTLLALDGALIRGALAFVLATEDDIDVVAELDRIEQVGPAIRSRRPDVAVVDSELLGTGGPAGSLRYEHSCPLLVLVDARRPRTLGGALHARSRTVGFLGNDVTPQRVVDGVRRLARGEPVVDADLVVAALNTESPLTLRETEVLEIAADGAPVVEIAARVGLSPGTVRNHLSRIAAKAGARTRIEAVRIAREGGWI
ncbi:response regulator transcription factor [Micromonospora sp. NBC_01699]|uniref:response regulator transcription factor n=1 Tax=Micromonospora sp. NBC_01699 TaxID=2975984 RepID=UPI002E35ED40|nr:response regulator transcription factor [Micromonospora sp. NBC_01699]